MSIRGMQRRMARHLRVVLYVVIGVFIVTLPAIFVPSQLRNMREREQEAEEGEGETAARVNGKPVTRSQVEQEFERLMERTLPFYISTGQQLDLAELWPARLGALEQVIVQELLLQQAEAESISVSRKELEARAEQLADEELAWLKDQFPPEELESRLAQLVSATDREARERVSERRFRDWRVKRILERPEPLREEMILARLRQVAVGSITAGELELLAEYDRATVREIEVLLRPEERAERTEEEARARAQSLAARAKGGQDFARLAREESDSPEAAETGGLLEPVGRGMMPLEWENAVFALGPEEISDPIKLPWGYSVVKMDKLEREIPEDFDAKKDGLLLQLAQIKQERAWRDYRTQLREKAEVQVLDPEMLAWHALQEGDVEKALAGLKEGLSGRAHESGIGPAIAFYQLAALLEGREEWQGAIEAYESSYDALARAELELAEVRAGVAVSIARCYEQVGDVEEATDWYETAGAASGSASVHSQVREAYGRLGQEELAAEEEVWLDEYRQAELARERELETLAQEEDEGASDRAAEGPPGARRAP